MKTNYISRLQAENAELKNRLSTIESAVSNFQGHLHSDKFAGTCGGERKDWISTGDVLNWLRDIKTESISS